MPVIPVGPVLPSGGPIPRDTARKLARTTAMAGLGLDCQYDEATGLFVGDCADYGIDQYGKPLVSSTQVGTGGSDWWQQILMGASKTYQQVLLNQNPAPVYRTGPGGTTVYQPTGQAMYGAVGPGGAAVGQSPAYGMGLGSNTTMLLVAGLVAVVVVMSKR